MKRTLVTVLLIIIMLLGMTPVADAADILPESLIGSTWYGEYTGHSGSDLVQRYMNMKIETCDSTGKITGKGYVTTVPGQGYDDQWINYEFKGEIDLSTGDCWMQGTKEISSGGDLNWNFAKFEGSFSYDDVKGTVDGYTNRTFYYARTSEWAMDEITEANSLGLIPETLKGKDLTKPISRAEFAAVCATAYEKLTDAEISPFTGYKFVDIDGNENEDYIRRAYAVNIAVGTSDKTFEPDKNLSRQEMATMLARIIKKYKFTDWTYATDSDYYLDTYGVQKFSDDDLIADWAKPSVYYLYKLQVIKGMSENPPIFAPYNSTADEEAILYATSTRQQAILLALRVYKISNMI